MGDIITNWYSLLAQFFNRLKGKPGSITSPSYEISMILLSRNYFTGFISLRPYLWIIDSINYQSKNK